MGHQFPIFSDHEALESLDNIAEHNPRVQKWLEFLTTYTYTLEYCKGSANGNADFLSRLPFACGGTRPQWSQQPYSCLLYTSPSPRDS